MALQALLNVLDSSLVILFLSLEKLNAINIYNNYIFERLGQCSYIRE